MHKINKSVVNVTDYCTNQVSQTQVRREFHAYEQTQESRRCLPDCRHDCKDCRLPGSKFKMNKHESNAALVLHIIVVHLGP